MLEVFHSKQLSTCCKIVLDFNFTSQNILGLITGVIKEIVRYISYDQMKEYYNYHVKKKEIRLKYLQIM